METRGRPTPSTIGTADVVRSAAGASLTPRARDALLVKIGEVARSFVPRRIPRDDRDDMVQEVVIRCWERMEQGRWTIADDASLVRLVRRMVQDRVVDHGRRKKRRAEREAEHGREVAESSHAWMSPELTREERELEALHDEIMADIPQASLQAYVMVRGEDAEHEAVAARLGVSREAVSSNVKRAQRRIRQRLKEHDIHAPSSYKPRTDAVSDSV